MSPFNQLPDSFINPAESITPSHLPGVHARAETAPVPNLRWLARVMAETDAFIQDSRERSERAGESELLKTIAI